MTPRADDPDLAAAVRSVHALAAGVYAGLAPGPAGPIDRASGRATGGASGNLVLSPYSLARALAMTASGARGTTLGELLQVLDAEDLDHLGAGFRALSAHVGSLAGARQRGDGSEAEVVLEVAGALVGQRGTAWQQEFLDVLGRDHGAGVLEVDFVDDAEQARATVNAWATRRTGGRIAELLVAGAVDQRTRLVLVDALHLAAPWEKPFPPGATRQRVFRLLDGTSVDVPTMVAGLDAAALGRGDGWLAVQLPYAGRQLALTVLLPDAGRLAEVEASVGSGGLVQVLASALPAQVDLQLPTWTFRTSAALQEPLAALGLTTAFGERADLTGMTRAEPLHLDRVVQQVFVGVDEEGTEAAAATAVVVGTTSMPVRERVVVDRPFLFVVHDLEHGVPLFLGRVTDPRDRD